MTEKAHQEITDLSPEEKRALLAKLLREKAAHSNTEHPLAYGQRGLWFVHQLAPESSAYHIALTSRIVSEVNLKALKQTFQHLVDRHAALRTTYHERDGELVQVIHAYQEAYFEHIDASGWSEEELYKQALHKHRQPFDLEHGPVIRWYLFTQSPTRHLFLITVHHIAFDGYSLFVVLDDLKHIYDAEVAGKAPSLPAVTAPYTQHVDQQLSLLSSPEGEKLRNYWHNQLSGELPILNLPTDHPRPPVQTYNGASYEFTIDAERTKRLRAFAMAEGVTLYVVMLSLFQTLLHRYSGQDDLLIGSPTSSRDLTLFEKTVGYFVDPLVLRSTIAPETTFRTLLSQTRKTVIDGVAHHKYPFLLLVEQLQLPNDPSRSPLFQVMFNLQSLQRVETTSPLFQHDEAGGASLLFEPYHMPHEEGQFDLVLDVMEAVGTLWCALKYNTDLYETTTIERIAGHYQALLEAALDNPDVPLADLNLLTAAERTQLLKEWNATQREYPHDVCLHQFFEQQVARTPDAVAVQFEDDTLTYDQLNRRANQLAAYLHKAGVGPEQKVGIYVERTLDTLVGLLGILKAGGCYVPLDPSYPKDRIALMVEDSQVNVLLTQESLLQQVPANHAQIICIDRDWPAIAQESDQPVDSGVGPNHLCYMIYTSGSTGKPKGVMVQHRNIANFFAGMDDYIPHDPPGVWLAVSSLSFDISLLELFWTLGWGFRIILYADNQAQKLAAGQLPSADGAKDYSIPALIERHNVTHMQCTPSRAEMLTISPESAAAIGKLHTLLVGGEAMSMALAQKLHELVPENLLNVYGPTETTVWATAYKVEAVQQRIPVGRPIINTTMYILDKNMVPVPVGLSGELYIGGAGVVRGYWNRPELTEERFVPDPFSDQPGARMYRTGDLARYLPDGNIDFLGRNDFQVKVRGYRIELGEIETLLDQHPAVQKAVVMAREDVPGDMRLVAYMVQQPGQPADTQQFRTYLREQLPDYMVPSAFVLIDAFPQTPSGKVDRRALPAPEQAQAETAPVEVQGVPQTPMEVLLAGIWRDVLKIDQISIYDNFFDLGGHSLQVMQVVTGLEKQIGVKIDPAMMRMYSLSQLAIACEGQPAASESQSAEDALPQKLFGTMRRLVTGKKA